MKRLLLATLVLLGAARFLAAQGNVPGTAGAPSPDCFFNGQVSATGTFGVLGGSGAYFDNTGSQCAIWHLIYTATSGASSISIELDGANTGTTFGTPGSFAALTGTPSGSSNPSTATGGAEVAMAPSTVPAYVQVKVNTLNGGQLKYWVIGYRPGISSTPGIGFGQYVVPSPNSTVISFQQAVTGSAVALATNTVKTMCVKALVGNTINVYIGPSGVATSTGMELAPGETWCGAVSNTNLVFVIASTTGANVSVIGTN